MWTFVVSSPLSASELGVIGICFVIISSLVRLITYMIKKKYEREDEQCKTFEKGKCVLYDEWKEIKEQIKEMHDIHLGPQAHGQNGVPRWFFREDAYRKIDEIYMMLARFASMTKEHAKVSKGESGSISRDSIRTYHNMCKLIETVVMDKLDETKKDIPKIRDTETKKMDVVEDSLDEGES